MSDPVEQGEQVDRVAYEAAIAQRNAYRTQVESLRERVRLLEQREKTLMQRCLDAEQIDATIKAEAVA